MLLLVFYKSAWPALALTEDRLQLPSTDRAKGSEAVLPALFTRMQKENKS
jgi:hypothetical protein